MTPLRVYFAWITGSLLLVCRTVTHTVVHKVRVKNSFSDISSLVDTTRPAAGGQQWCWSIFCCLLCHGCQGGRTWAEWCCLSWAYKEYWLECKHMHACLRAHTRMHTHRKRHKKAAHTSWRRRKVLTDSHMGNKWTERLQGHVGKSSSWL